MSKILNDQVVIVTGGASGLGKVTAMNLANRGASVAIVDLNEDNLNATSALSKNITQFKCDVSDFSQVKSVVTDIERELGSVFRLYHCAGVAPAQAIKDDTPEKNGRVMAINYGGTVNFISAVLPGMLQRNAGQIVVYGSLTGLVPFPTLSAYCASKAAVKMYMEVLARELKVSDVHTLLVCPATVQTPIVLQSIETHGESVKEAYDKRAFTPPEKIVAEVECALEQGKTQVWPDSAKWQRRLQLFAPGLLSWLIDSRK